MSDIRNVSIQQVISDALVSYSNRSHEGNESALHRFDFIDLFAGIGGMRIAFERAGGRCVFSSEWDKNCQKTYFSNFGEIPYGDITKINAKDIPNHDILVAGFPCQPFSIAGVSKKNSMGRATGFADKTQGTLFFDVCRIIAEKRPKAFLLENVKNLKSHDKGRTWEIINNSLKELNYSVFYGVFDGQDFVPQHRERILIVGFDNERYGETSFAFDYLKPNRKMALKDILEPSPDERYILTDHLWKYLQAYAAKHKAAGNGFGFGMPDINGISRTLSARYYKDGSEILINRGLGLNPRRLTPRECARLQGYPDSFKIVVSDTQAYKQFGNSVVVPLIAAVAKLIVEELDSLRSVDKRTELSEKFE
jgi:DNA (cytosine-5)-methyltransferase 1